MRLRSNIPLRRAACLVLAFVAAAAATDPSLERHQALCSRLYEELVAPCCWTASIAVHQSIEAEQMRREVGKLVAQGSTEGEIRAIFVARYGERVLTEPDGARRLTLYFVPIFLMLCALSGLVVYLRRFILASGDHQRTQS